METEIYPNIRLNRLRQNEEIRNMLDSPVPGPEKFIWPIFIKEGKNLKEPVVTLPKQFYYSIDRVCEDIKKVIEQGIKSILIFGVIEKKLRSNNAEEKTPSKNQRFFSVPSCRLSLRSHDLTTVMRKNLADFSQINFTRSLPLRSVKLTSHNPMLNVIEKNTNLFLLTLALRMFLDVFLNHFFKKCY